MERRTGSTSAVRAADAGGTRRRLGGAGFAFALLLGALTVSAASVVLQPPAPASAAQETCTPEAGYNRCVAFTYSGADQPFVVPPGVTSVNVKVWGAGGGGSRSGSSIGAPGGSGAFVQGRLAVAAGDAFTVVVGEGGGADGQTIASARCQAAYGFGGACPAARPNDTRHVDGGGGGGLSGLFSGSAAVTATTQARAVLIAGGGGGAEGTNGCGNTSAAGGAGGNGFSGGMPSMQGTAGVLATPSGNNTSTGGGGGYAGGTTTTRLRFPATGTCAASANGGSNFVAGAVTGATNLPGVESTTLPDLTPNDPPRSTDPHYTTGVGVGQNVVGTPGGDGRVVIQYRLPALCNAAPNGSFEEPNIQGNPNSAYNPPGYAQYLTNQATISGWSVVAGTVDILRWYSTASDGEQSIDMFGVSPGTLEQTFPGLVPGQSYTFHLDYAGLSTTQSTGTVSLDTGSGFANLQTLAPTAASTPGGTPPAGHTYNSTWATYSHTFVATSSSATIRIANRTQAGPGGTGLFIDNFRFDGPCEDFGDAPRVYDTQEVDDGPRHLIGAYDEAARTGDLMLGTSIDDEADGPYAGGAIADDMTDIGDEDGVSAPIDYDIATPETVDVAYTNDTGASATLAGWIDIDRDGTFGVAERQVVTVPAGSGSVSLTFPALAGTGNTYARFRLFAGSVADPAPTGLAVGGEVEDYRVAGPPTVLTCAGAPNGSFEDPDVETHPDRFMSPPGYASYLTNQSTISGWNVVDGSVDILRWFSNASDGDQSIDMWGVSPGAIEQSFTGLVPGDTYMFSLDYSGLRTASSIGTVALDTGSGFTTLRTLAPVADATSSGPPPAATSFTVTWSTFTHAFVAASTEATIRITNQVAPGLYNTGLFIDDFQMTSPDCNPPLVTCTAEEVRATERHWFFGANAAIDFGVSGTTATPIAGQQSTMEGSTVVTDTAGNLQFWSNGQVVFDRNSNPMPNGSGLLGNASATQTVAAFPAPGQPGRYIVVTTSTDVGVAPNGSLRYSLVDMSLNGGLGDVVAGSKNVALGSAGTAGEAIVAAPSADGSTFWVLTFTNNSPNVLAYEFGATGPITGTPVVSVMPTNNYSGYGSLSFNADMTRLVAQSSQYVPASTGTSPALVRLLIFDADSGQVFEQMEWALPDTVGSGSLGYSADFSPDGDYVYATKIFGGAQLYRYRIAGATTAAEVKATEENVGSIGAQGGQVRRAPDGRMYIANRLSPTLSVVNDPDDAVDPDFVTGGFALATGTTSQFGLPQMVTGCPPASFTDRGDLPADYGTAAAQNGPRHSIVGYDPVNHTAPLMLGSTVDAEADGVATAAADGDDVAGVDDEDAFSGTISLPPGVATFSMPVPVTNTGAATATLYAWIDANHNGSFQPGEIATASVPPGATSATVTWTGLPALVDGTQPYLRFRLTSNALVDNPATATIDERAVGSAVDGEVEDHRGLVATAFPLTCAVPFVETFGAGAGRGPALPIGQTTYTYDGGGQVVDGTYTIIDDAATTGGWWWHTGADHTPGDVSGRMMLVNASVAPGLFFQRTFTGLVAGGVYDFSSWITNANRGGSPSLPNVTFRVVDPGTGVELATTNTGNLPNVASLVWNRFGLAFTATQSTVRLELVNNSPGGNGNDLAIDDIGFAQYCEFGDAPNSYGTTLASGGPGHIAGGPTLGTARDTENDGQPTTTANGDDATGTDDEDGVAAPIAIAPGEPTTVTVAATNNSAVDVTLAGWIDLDGNGAFDPAERVTVVVPAGSGTANRSLAFPAGTTTTATFARFRIYSEVVADPSPVGLAAGGEVEDHPVTVQLRRLQLAKTSDATAGSRPGDVITYTVTATNVGDAPYTALNPAVVVDDLAGVVDDADYNGDAGANRAPTTPAYTVPQISWVGPLAAGDTVTITYTVTLVGGGDGLVRNVAFQPPCTPGAPGCTPTPPLDCVGGLDPQTGLPCFEHEFELPKLTVGKAASSTALPAIGETLTYTVTVANDGPGDYTISDPATFTDNLIDVIDDTSDPTVTDATIGSATFTSPNLTWTGVLLAGQSATITYDVTYDGGGDHVLTNLVCVPATEAQDPANPCDSVRVPAGAIVQSKVSDPPTGTSVQAGDEITYTLSFENIGTAPADVSTHDDLAGVLDDATITAAPTAEDGLIATPNGQGFDITGTVPVGETLRVTYSVRVAPFADQGDHVLRNALACQAGSPPGCAPDVTEHPVRQLQIVKTSDATASAKPGDVIHYTITASNIGTGDYTDAVPAPVVDDLTAVLDDAAYNDDAAADRPPAPSFTDPQISWAGALPAGQAVQLTYSVTLAGGGDGTVHNVAFQPPCDPTDPGCDPVPPEECDDGLDPDGFPCDEIVTQLPKLTITKAASTEELPQLGAIVGYTVVVTNEGPGDYTPLHPATFSDDLSAVIDDTTDPTGITATSGTATFSAPHLSWTGVLAAGQSATIEYTVTYDAAGDHELVNNACVPEAEAEDPDEDCATVTVRGANLIQSKSVNPASGTAVDNGGSVTYTLTFQNTGIAPASVDTSDDLSGVLDDATITTGPTAESGLEAAVDGQTIDITGTVPAGETRTVTYVVRVAFTAQGDHVLRNALACQPGSPPGCLPTITENPIRNLQIVKTSTATASSRPGDVITYTVTATNTGTGAYTALEPAVVLDDLAGVLDDASYDGNAAADRGPAPSYSPPRVSWVGELAAAQTVRITYTVTLRAGGDGSARNVAFQPPCTPGPNCAPVTPPSCVGGLDPNGLPCDDVTLLLPKLTIVKRANRTDLPAVDETVTYEVIVTNQGPGDYTASDRGSFTDDLSDVIDDATMDPLSITATVGEASYSAPDLSWSGVLVAGQSSTITYTLTYTGDGDHRLVNDVCVPVTEAQHPLDPCRSVQIPGSGLQQRKSADPPAGTSLDAGDTVTYTLYFENVGATAAAVDTIDDISGVVDDATPVGGVDADAGLTATPTPDGQGIEIVGSVPAGETRTVTYVVSVAFTAQGDHVLRNVLACQDGPGCLPAITEHPIRHLSLTKVSNAPVGVDTGDTVSYTLTVTNDGEGDYTADQPGSISDDLTGVLDDAVYNDDAAAGAGSVTFAAPMLTWSGALAGGEVATITYSVSVTNLGDHTLVNTASVPNCTDPTCNPPAVIVPLPHVVPGKQSDPASGTELQAGDVVTYRLTFTNDGEATGVVDSTDDLADILDDGDVTGEPVADDPGVTVTRNGDRIRVVGPIAVDDTITVTYQVTIKPDGQRGDNVARNVLSPDTPQVTCTLPMPAAAGFAVLALPDECPPVVPPSTEHPVGELADWKSVDPGAGTSVQAGRTVTYTLHFTNVGEAPVDVNRDDVLSGVLDDATLVSGPASSDPALSVSAVTNGRITMTGSLAPDQAVTVTYVATVNPDGARGDNALGNFLVDPGATPPDECVPTDPQRPDCTSNPVTAVAVVKSSNPPPGTDVSPGGSVTYTLAFTNTSAAGPVAVDHTDHLADVVDDADVTGGPSTSSPALSASFGGAMIHVTGQLAAGQTVTVSYTVTLKAYDQQGNHQLVNIVARTGDQPVCSPGSQLCTSHRSAVLVPPPPPSTPPTAPTPDELPGTGGNGTPILQIGALLLALGAIVLGATRRNLRRRPST